MKMLSRLMIGIAAFAVTHSASAEWRPGRERPVMAAQMLVSGTEGAFEGLRSVHVVKSIASDADQSKTFFTLRVENKDLRLAVASTEMTRCGRITYFLAPADAGIKLGNGTAYEIALQEDTLWGHRCGAPVETQVETDSMAAAADAAVDTAARGASHWTLIYKHKGLQSVNSLVAEGKPEVVYTTLAIQDDEVAVDQIQPVKPYASIAADQILPVKP